MAAKAQPDHLVPLHDSEGRDTALSAVVAAPNSAQLNLAGDNKNEMRRGGLDQDRAKQAIRFLGQLADWALMTELKLLPDRDRDVRDVLEAVLRLRSEHSRAWETPQPRTAHRGRDLRTTCLGQLLT